jgi:hypothetical protein
MPSVDLMCAVVAGALGVVAILMTLLAIISVSRQAKLLSLLYILFLVMLVVVEFVSVSESERVADKLEANVNRFWDRLSDPGKVAVQSSLQCCGLAGTKDRPANGQECPEEAVLGCGEKVLKYVATFRERSYVMFISLAGFEVIIAVTTFFLVFLC